MKKSNKHGSVFTLLLGNYILLTIFLLLFVSVLFINLLQNMKGIVSDIAPARIADYDPILVEQRYEDFPIKRLLGGNGGIRILDSQCQTVYENGEPLRLSNLDKEDIACIPEYSMAPEITKTEYATVDGRQQVSVAIRENRKGGAAFRNYILDENNNIVYQSGDLPMDRLTQRQVRFLSDSYSESYSVQKHTFRTADGGTYTMLLMCDPARPETAETLARSVSDFLILCILAYCAMTLLFFVFLRKKIKKPLHLLCSELNNFENGENRQAVYCGPKEFVEIFDCFNALSRRLMHSEEERAKLEADRQKLLADISHDLRTPISVVQGYAKALHDGVIPSEQQTQYLEIIEQKASGLSELLSTFYEYSKMEHPDYTLRLIPCDICNTLRDYIADRYAELELAGFFVEVDIPEEHISCGMDTIAFRRALDNLVNNCMKHNPNGTTLSVSLNLCVGQIRIVLADNGVGIPAGVREDIFTPFVVGEASRSKQGSGLGLSIARKIMEAHHGRISSACNIEIS